MCVISFWSTSLNSAAGEHGPGALFSGFQNSVYRYVIGLLGRAVGPSE